MTRMMPDACPLVMVEWEDSAQPIPGWGYLASMPVQTAVKCVSVGWLIQDGCVKAVAPNMGGIEENGSVQVSGVIRIPTRCIVRITKLAEPLVGATCSGPSSRLG